MTTTARLVSDADGGRMLYTSFALACTSLYSCGIAGLSVISKLPILITHTHLSVVQGAED